MMLFVLAVVVALLARACWRQHVREKRLREGRELCARANEWAREHGLRPLHGLRVAWVNREAPQRAAGNAQTALRAVSGGKR